MGSPLMALCMLHSVPRVSKEQLVPVTIREMVSKGISKKAGFINPTLHLKQNVSYIITSVYSKQS